jgi:hypothetical protein
MSVTHCFNANAEIVCNCVDEDENEEYVPPKPEPAAFTEPDAFYTVR